MVKMHRYFFGLITICVLIRSDSLGGAINAVPSVVIPVGVGRVTDLAGGDVAVVSTGAIRVGIDGIADSSAGGVVIPKRQCLGTD